MFNDMGSWRYVGGDPGATLLEWNGIDHQMSSDQFDKLKWTEWHDTFYARPEFNRSGNTPRKFWPDRRVALPTVTSWYSSAHHKHERWLRESGITGYAINVDGKWRFMSPQEAARSLGVVNAVLSCDGCA